MIKTAGKSKPTGPSAGPLPLLNGTARPQRVRDIAIGMTKNRQTRAKLLLTGLRNRGIVVNRATCGDVGRQNDTQINLKGAWQPGRLN